MVQTFMSTATSVSIKAAQILTLRKAPIRIFYFTMIIFIFVQTVVIPELCEFLHGRSVNFPDLVANSILAYRQYCAIFPKPK